MQERSRFASLVAHSVGGALAALKLFCFSFIDNLLALSAFLSLSEVFFTSDEKRLTISSEVVSVETSEEVSGIA